MSVRGPIERFHVLYLDRKNRIISDELLSTGTVDHVPVYPREVIKRSLELGATAIILVHNHPTGDPTPSPQDLASTRNLTAAGKVVGIEVLDHIIVGEPSSVCPRGYLSLREENLL